MPTAAANGITINYQLEGPAGGDLVVLINGLVDDLHFWDLQVPALLSAGFRVLRYDNRGIGHSTRPPGPYTAELLADDLRSLLETLAVGAFHLLGVSMGGMIAQTYALKYPNRVKRPRQQNHAHDHGESTDTQTAVSGPEMLSLSLCCTYAQPTGFCSRMFALWGDMATKMSVAAVMRDVLLWSFTVPFFRTREAECRELEAAMDALNVGLDEYLAQLNVIQAFNSTSRLEELKAGEMGLGGLESGRIMVLAGKVDILIPVVLSRELADSIEGARFVTTKGGHGCTMEFPQDFNKTVIEFLNEYKSNAG